MTPAARLSAAIAILTEIEQRRRPAVDTLRDWGLTHRFAGSSDRAAVAGLVYDCLRRRASAAFVMASAAPRGVLLGMLKLERGLDLLQIERLCTGTNHAPVPLSEDERARLVTGSLEGASPPVRGDYPEWLDRHFARTFAEERVLELAALARRAPLDLRVNTLKGNRDRVSTMLTVLRPTPTPWSPVGLRINLAPEAKNPSIPAEPAFIKGLVEVQDEGSQLTTLFSEVRAGEQVVDLCAGAGGKTLALSALMGNHGQIYATDSDKRRLAPIHARLRRAGVRNVQVRTPAGDGDVLADLNNRADLVVVDAPCSGTGVWRRNPDAKWRIRPGALAQHLQHQTLVLDRAAPLLRLGGRLIYITCSVLEEENTDQIRAFLDRHQNFDAIAPSKLAQALGTNEQPFQDADGCSRADC